LRSIISRSWSSTTTRFDPQFVMIVLQSSVISGLPEDRHRHRAAGVGCSESKSDVASVPSTAATTVTLMTASTAASTPANTATSAESTADGKATETSALKHEDTAAGPADDTTQDSSDASPSDVSERRRCAEPPLGDVEKRSVA